MEEQEIYKFFMLGFVALIFLVTFLYFKFSDYSKIKNLTETDLQNLMNNQLNEHLEDGDSLIQKMNVSWVNSFRIIPKQFTYYLGLSETQIILIKVTSYSDILKNIVVLTQNYNHIKDLTITNKYLTEKINNLRGRSKIKKVKVTVENKKIALNIRYVDFYNKETPYKEIVKILNEKCASNLTK